jgi:hypothetical protein
MHLDDNYGGDCFSQRFLLTGEGWATLPRDDLVNYGVTNVEVL